MALRFTNFAAPTAMRRRAICPDLATFNGAMDMRAAVYGKSDWEPAGATADLLPGTYYLVKVDDQYRRTYARA